MLLKVIYCNWSSEKNLHWHSFAKYTRVWVITVIVLQLITVQIIAKRCPCVFVDKLWSRKKNLKQFEAVCLLEDYVSLNILWLFGVFKRKRRDRMTWNITIMGIRKACHFMPGPFIIRHPGDERFTREFTDLHLINIVPFPTSPCHGWRVTR